MYVYKTGSGSIWVSPYTPPEASTNTLWLKQNSDPKQGYQLLFYNVNNATGRWQNLTPGYVLFDNVHGIAQPTPDFYPVESNDYIAYIGSGAGVYTNFIQQNGKPITITNINSLVLLHKEKNSKYWTYKEIDCKGPQGDSAYDLAVLGGYTRSLEQFYKDLAQVSNKVDKVPGLGLSQNNYTDDDQVLVNQIPDKVNRRELSQVAFTGQHNDTLGILNPNCHPIEAITGLQSALDKKQPVGNYAHLDANGKVIETANNSDKLNSKLESQLHVDTADKAIGDEDAVNIKINYAKKVELEHLIQNVTYDGDKGVWIFTFVDGHTVRVDQPIEQVVKSGYYDEATKEVVLVLYDDSEIRIPVGSLIDIYTGGTTDTTITEVDPKKTIKVIVKDYVSKTYVDNALSLKEDKSKLKALAYKDTSDYTTDVSGKPKLNGNIIQAENTTDSLGLEHNIVFIGNTTPIPIFKELWIDTSDESGLSVPLYETSSYQSLLPIDKTIIGAINELYINANNVRSHTKRVVLTTTKPSIESNIFYIWETPQQTLTITLAPSTRPDLLSIYSFQFTTNTQTPVISISGGIKWANNVNPQFKPSTTYQIQIKEGIGTFIETT